MKNDGRTAARPRSTHEPRFDVRKAIVDAQLAIDADQTSADDDQSAADADQTLSDADTAASAIDQADADRDQAASDHDQETADRERAMRLAPTPADESAYATSRDERETMSIEREVNRLERAATGRDRDATASNRDRIADARDQAGRSRDARAADLARVVDESDAPLMKQLAELSARAAADRARAAADRARAGIDRANAARERARLEAELRSAHLDDLTGAYRREMGRLALSHEIDRARRSDGRFVLAFVDVDRFKDVNDRDGHATGDRILQTVVRAIRTKLRSFDPIIRYGGDEFVCGLIGTDLAEAEHRFEGIRAAIEAEAGISISVGLAALSVGETVDQLTERADAAMLLIKAKHHSR
ncbi:MAG TPA: GGDEF domain-containing protein [Candidatus Limnocylindrales bacterium]